MDFGQAIERLKQGKKVARKANTRTVKHIGKDKPLDCQPYIVMWTAEQKWQPGWLASQSDMLAEDWQVVGD